MPQNQEAFDIFKLVYTRLIIGAKGQALDVDIAVVNEAITGLQTKNKNVFMSVVNLVRYLIGEGKL